MARNHFAIERPRKISISIQGYDADASTRAQQKKQQERAQRHKRRQKSPPPNKPSIRQLPPAAPCGSDEDVEKLAAAAAGQPISPEAEQQLCEAFAGSGSKGRQ